MWSELIRTRERLDWMLWPRSLALAERSWHKSSWERELELPDDKNENPTVSAAVLNETLLMDDWARFATTVGQKELRRLDSLGVAYYLPRPGARYVMSLNSSYMNGV